MSATFVSYLMILANRYLGTSTVVQGASQPNSDDGGAVHLNVSVWREIGGAVQEGPKRFPDGWQ